MASKDKEKMMTKSHEIDFRLYGDDMQFVEIELNEGGSALAEVGTLMYMDDKISMETIFGDGLKKQGKGIVGKLFGTGKRFITGEGLCLTLFTNVKIGKGRVAFAAPYPGKILPFHLSDYDKTIICQNNAFVCAVNGVSVGIHFQKRMSGFWGRQGFIMQKLHGDGLVFLHAGGTITKKKLSEGESLRIDTGCLVAMSAGVDYDIEFVGDVKSALFGVQGVFLATLTGPGSVWLQSLPMSRMANRMMSALSSENEESNDLNNPLEELTGLTNLIGRD